VDHAIVFRINPWLLMAIVAAVLVVSATLIVVSHTGLIHAISSMLQGPAQMAPWCGTSGGGCP
jgi:hypothetical protein